MKNYSFLLLLCLSILACRNEAADSQEAEGKEVLPAPSEPKADYTIYPGQGFGPVNGTLDQTEITNLVGEEKVVKKEFYIGEGEFAPGLAIYPDSPEEIAVLLDEDGEILAYRIEHVNSQWATDSGVKVGSTIEEIEAANGGPFKLTGFEWDYGGTVTSWEGGNFEGKDFSVRFYVEHEGNITEEDMRKIIGDQQILSSEPVLRKHNVRVDRITQHYLLEME